MNYLICGNSFNLIDKEIEKIVGNKTKTVYSLEDVSLKEIVEDLGYNSLFADEKVVILKDVDFTSAGKKDTTTGFESLEAYLDNPSETATLIIVLREKVGSRGPLKKLASKMKVIETPIISKPYELVKLLGEEMKKEGYSISTEALNIFVEKCAVNYDIASSEFGKLKKMKGSNKNISTADVVELVSNYSMNDSFGFKDAVINLNISKAMKMLDDLEAAKMETVAIVIMLAKEYEAIYNVKLFASLKMSNEKISTEMGGMHTYRVKLLREVGNKYSLEKLEKIITYLCNLNLKLVSVDNLDYDELRKFFIEVL